MMESIAYFILVWFTILPIRLLKQIFTFSIWTCLGRFLMISTFGIYVDGIGIELSPRVVHTKQTQWQGILGPTGLRSYSFSPTQFHPGVEIFKGIPFASPPVSQLRFERPSPISLLSNKTYIANQTKYPCPKQYDSLNIYKGPDLYRRIKNIETHEALEDCLYLDIYAPRYVNKNSAHGLPVLVYANSHGEDEEDPFDGSSLAAIGKIIVVTFRYRVGVLGFLNPGYNEDNRKQGNFGLWDQLLALQWVRENINGFGGDESNVSLMGSDLDAAFVGVLALSPLSQAYGGLFHRLILLNGSPLSPLSLNQRPLETTAHVARALNCPLYDLSGDVGRCFRTRQLDQLLGASHNIGLSLFNNHFAPSVDETMVFNTLANINSAFPNTDAIKEALGRYDVLAGLAEGTILPNIGQPSSMWQSLDFDLIVSAILRLALQLDPGSEPSEILTDELRRALVNEYEDPNFFKRDILADFLTVYPMIRLLNLQSQTGKNTFFYVSKNYNPLGKSKNSDVSYIFSNSVYKWKYIDHSQPNPDLQPYELLITFLANFVRSGDPNVINPNERYATPRKAAWPKYRMEKGTYLRFGRQVEVESKWRRRFSDFWLYTFPAIIKNHVPPSEQNQYDYNPGIAHFPIPYFPSSTTGGGNIGGPRVTMDVAQQPESTDPSLDAMSSLAQNTVVMAGAFLLLLNLFCCLGLFYQRQRLKRNELRYRSRYISTTNSPGQEHADATSTRGQLLNEHEEGTRDGNVANTIQSDGSSEPYGYIKPIQSIVPPHQQPSRSSNHIRTTQLDALSETETDNGFGDDFLGPNYDPRTKVTRWMFGQHRSVSGDSGGVSEQIPMSPINGTSRIVPTVPPQPPYSFSAGPFQPSISSLQYADSCTTIPSVVNYPLSPNYKTYTPQQCSFNNNLSTNNFNMPMRRPFPIPSPSNSATTTLSNPDSRRQRASASLGNAGFAPLRHSMIVQEAHIEECPNDPDEVNDPQSIQSIHHIECPSTGVIIEDALTEVQSSKPKLVPIKHGTLKRSVGVGDTNIGNANDIGGDDNVPLIPPSSNLQHQSPPINRQGPKVTFAEHV